MAAVGKVQSAVPNMVNPSNVIAQKVANVAVPATANSMWDKLGAVEGLKTSAPMSNGFGGNFNSPQKTTKLQGLSTSLVDNSRYKLDLPNLAAGPKQGIASPMQEVAGGKGSGMQKGNTMYVDDAGWGVTLKDIIGSKLLTTEQLQKASIQNVKKLFKVGLNNTNHKGSSSVGTAQENEELYYMAQRMMIEGFIRGVDITKELEKQGGLNIAIRGTSYNANAKKNIGLAVTSSGMDSVNFNARFWRNANEAERYTLFLHELGHNLLNRPELGSSLKYDIMGDGPVGVAKKLMSSKETYNRILDQHFGARNNKSLTAINRTPAGSGTAQFDPSWFPQLSGEQVAMGGGVSVGGGNDGNGTPAYPDYSSNFNEINNQFTMMQKMMADSMAQNKEFMQEQAIMNAVNAMPDPSATPAAMAMDNSVATAAQGSSALMQGGGDINLTGFASQLANLESDGGDGGGALNLISG